MEVATINRNIIVIYFHSWKKIIIGTIFFIKVAFAFAPSAAVSLIRLELYLNDVEISMVTLALFTWPVRYTSYEWCN